MTETRKIAKNDVRPCVCRFFCVPLHANCVQQVLITNTINMVHIQWS